jgi:hypothetical protein
MVKSQICKFLRRKPLLPVSVNLFSVDVKLLLIEIKKKTYRRMIVLVVI